ncbi:hypothetical protein RvY_10532 [Ramazzottius varieornatus]|uniref:Uncharacterized protein n=1 Tax=Ramazzottius varieornatus TaxID=947166 RepID=A0A1D1VFH3_RAMVA|nr:hypothetical protein RvY_10532 [Ramazzottius varieornatus]
MQTLSRQTRATKPTSQVKMRDSFSCANKSENCTVVCSYRQFIRLRAVEFTHLHNPNEECDS